MLPDRSTLLSPGSPRLWSATRLAAVLIAVVLLVWLVSTGAEARNTIRQSFLGAYPSVVGTQLESLPSLQGHCGVCHYQFTGAGARNPYGVRLGQVIGNFPNNDAGRQQAMHSIENEDPDADGFSSLTEITDTITYTNTPTFPGLTPSNVGQISGVPPSEVLGFLVPTTGSDTQAPVVTILSPNGSESWTAGTIHSLTWTATDNVGVIAIDLFYRKGTSEPWEMLARNLSNSGTFTWHVHNTPTAGARVRAVAKDAAANTGEDASNADFTILIDPDGTAPTTLRDFHQPGTQPFGVGTMEPHTNCTNCHGGYNTAVEPGHNWAGSMMAQAGRDPLFFACLAVAEQDAPSSGDLCLRCHSAFGWLDGRSNPTDGTLLTGTDFDGVSCDLCHRLVNPIYTPGQSPPEDADILAALGGEVPASHANGQFVVDPDLRRRGPFSDLNPPHPFLFSPFHRSSEICGTCHDVSNPVFVRVEGVDYAPGPLDEEPGPVLSHVHMPLERTYSEWLNSAFPAGVYAPEFAGNKPDGIVATCQDCHMPDVLGKGATGVDTPTRPDLPLHDMTGGSSWMPAIVAALYPGEVDPVALADGAARAVSMLERAATVDLAVEEEGGGYEAVVTVTNRSGHKLPTGYPEGRRMWIHLVARDENGQVVYESGAYDAATGVLTHDADARIYEAELGISPGLAAALGIDGGKSFHFALNDSVYKDNRIPPMGFTNAAFAAFGGPPVDPSHPGDRYEDGQYWDTAVYTLPASARSVRAVLRYQSTSKEYVEFLRDENTTNDTGDLIHQVWSDHGRAAPVTMAADSMDLAPGALPEDPAGSAPVAVARLSAGPTPFSDRLEIRLDLPSPATTRMEIIDPTGRRIRSYPAAPMAGRARLTWDGRDDSGHPAPSGVYWVRAVVGDRTLQTRTLRVR